MSGTNGHSNGHHNGHTGPLPTSDGHHDRADAALRVSAIRKRLQEANADDVPLSEDMAFLRKCARECRGRTAASAAKGVLDARAKFLELGIKLAEFEDKQDRLDTGKTTENVAHYEVRMPEARGRLGEPLED